MTTKIATATRRSRLVRGNSYLTHGSDSYDKRGKRKATRVLNRALIAEAIADEGEDVPSLWDNDPQKVEFRLVIWTQVYENYSDDPDKYGDHWKPKGGYEYHTPLGSAGMVLALGPEGVQDIEDALIAKITRNDKWMQEFAIGGGVFSTEEETGEEIMYRQLFEEGYMGKEEYERRIEDLHKDVLED